MSSILLWISILGFTGFAPGLLISLNRSVKSRLELDRIYSFILFLFCFWLFLYSFLFFFSTFVLDLPRFWIFFFTLFRTMVSALILYSYGRLVGPVLNKGNRAVTFFYRIIPVLYILSVLAYLKIGSPYLASVITICVSIYMVLLSILGYLSQGIKSDPYYRRFFIISGIYNISLFVFVFFQFFFPVHAEPEILFRALFCFFLGTNEIIRMFNPDMKNRDAISSDFLNFYKITDREKDVIELIGKGFPVSRIADQLFISKRTVETHLYNIYSKCNIQNRIELMHLMETFSLRNNT